MPESEYTNTLANMIAQHRPRRAGGGHGVMRAGGGGLVKGRETEIGVGINAEPFLKLFGWQSPEDKQKTWDRLITSLNEMEDDQRELYESQPETQSILSQMRKAGYPIITEMDKKGMPRHRVPKKSLESRLAGRTEHQILAGGGPGATNLVGGIQKAREKTPTEMQQEQEQLTAKGTQQIRVARESGVKLPEQVAQEREAATEASQRKIKEDIAVKQAEGSPSVIKMNQMAAFHSEQAALKERAQTAQVGPDAESARRLQTAQATYYIAEANRADAQARKATKEADDLAKGLGVENVKNLLEVNKAYDTASRAWAKDMSDFNMSNPKNAEVALGTLSDIVHEHISGVKAYSGSGKGAERSIRRWFSMADREFSRAPITPGILGAIRGGPSQAMVDETKRLRNYITGGLGMIKAAGTASTDLYETTVRWNRELVGRQLFGRGLSDMMEEIQATKDPARVKKLEADISQVIKVADEQMVNMLRE